MIRVASYCRVSTDREDQANSFEAQQQYFREYILRHPDWELYDVYADEGITGTSTEKRPQFQRMMSDAYAGKFQLIITKEVSRFSRNILDTISYTRELKSIGVHVQFAIDGIHTGKPDAELYLSIMASLAQEESRKTSSRVVWGQTRQMEKGVVFGHSLLGYDVHNGHLTVNPEGAETVRTIFEKYALEQVSTSDIARCLTEKQPGTQGRNYSWTSNSIIRILKNEKYVGDLIQKKSYTPDYLTHKKQRNTGEVPVIRIQDHHEPIVSREIWNLAQQRLAGKQESSKFPQSHARRHLFSGKIRCGECGASFVTRYKYNPDGTKYRRWSCATSIQKGTAACGVAKLLRDDDALGMLKTAIAALQMDCDSIVNSVSGLNAFSKQIPDACEEEHRIRQETERIQRKKEKVMDSYFSGDISKEDMQTMNRHYNRCLDDLKCQEQRLHSNCHPEQVPLKEITASILSGETESESFLKSMLDQITVFKDRHIELKLVHLPQIFYFTGHL